MSILLGAVESQYDLILDYLNKEGSLSYENYGWIAFANKKNNAYSIIFEEGYWTFTRNNEVHKFYKSPESWAKRVSQLIRKGF
jgi:hypothetical protein